MCYWYLLLRKEAGKISKSSSSKEQAQLLLDRVLVLWNQYLREHGRVVDGFIVDN